MVTAVATFGLVWTEGSGAATERGGGDVRHRKCVPNRTDSEGNVVYN